jgi:hypothetical protein
MSKSNGTKRKHQYSQYNKNDPKNFHIINLPLHINKTMPPKKPLVPESGVNGFNLVGIFLFIFFLRGKKLVHFNA